MTRRVKKPRPAVTALAGFVARSSPGELAVLGGRALLGSLGLASREKVFAIGMNKAGTSSLHATFDELGYTSYHGTRWRDGRNRWLLNAFDCFSDGPPDDFVSLDRDFPGARFILNVREFDAWVLSRLKHIARDKQRDPGRRFPRDWDVTEEAIAIWLEHREAHHAHVMDHFANRPSDLLVVNFVRDPGAAVKVARFLGREPPRAKAWANAANDRGAAAEHRVMLDAVLRNMDVPKAAARHDLFVRPPADGRFPVDTAYL